ncbi:MAG: STAS domain-containing protein [Acidobacteriota bacterium]|jgi:anti-sigma B factor antagonist
MEINVRTAGDVTVLDLKGNLTLGAGEQKMREVIDELLARGRTKLLLNLAAVPVLDSSGIGAIIKSFTTAKKDGGKLKLLNLSRLARQLLSITGLLSVLEVFDDEASALASF